MKKINELAKEDLSIAKERYEKSMWFMSKLVVMICLFGMPAIMLACSYRLGKSDNVIRAQQATIAKQQLIIDSLRNPVDTTEFLTEHSEIRK